MKMRRIFFLLFFPLFFSSCSFYFTENCDYRGNLKVSLDWDGLWTKVQHPECLRAIIYKENHSVYDGKIHGDTILRDIPAGRVRALFFNPPEDKSFPYFTESEFFLQTFFDGNVRVIEPCPMICSWQRQIEIPIHGTVSEIVSPIPLVKQINFILNIRRNDVSGTVDHIKGYLSGIPTGYSLSRNEPIRSKGTVVFAPKRDNKSSKERYIESFYVLGTNPPHPEKEDIKKKASFFIKLSDGEIQELEIDVSEQLNHFSANIFLCEVTIDITTAVPSIEITSWKEGVWDEFTLS